MISVKTFLKVMLRSALIVAFLSIPNPVVAFTGLRNWSRKALYTKVDLCTQSCYSQIIPGLYISNARAASDHSVLRRLGVTHVLTVDSKRLPYSTFDNTNMSTLYINARDSIDTQLMCYFPIANAFIEDGVKNGSVIVHCHLGVSRSPTLVIAYMMEKYKLSFQEAFAYIKKRRPFVNPNTNFVKQLKQYEENRYYVSGYKRLEAYMKVNSGENKIKIVSAAVICAGFIIPVVFLLL